MNKELLNSLKDLARNAGDAILKVYDSEDFQIDIKDDESPLTRADREANKIICDGLLAMEPDIPIISEESKSIPYDERKHFQRFWLVDPLDGTKEFIKRNGDFTINIALVEVGQPIMGIVYVPVTKELFYAIKGEGAFWEKDGATEALNVAVFGIQDPGLKVVCSRSHLNPSTQDFINQLNQPVTVSRGSALKFMLIASGEAQLYPRVAPTMEWDTAAAQCIVEEAGGFLVEYESRMPLHYNKESLLNPDFLAGGNLRKG